MCEHFIDEDTSDRAHFHVVALHELSLNNTPYAVKERLHNCAAHIFQLRRLQWSISTSW